MSRKIDTWDKFGSWQLVLPPSRPAAWQLAQIRKAALAIDRSVPVAVLGSTPEFRDLLAELGFSRVHVFEKNLGFYHKMSVLRCLKSRETLVRADWLDSLPGFANQFGLILSDLTSGNIPYEQRGAFYASISRSLVQNGVFIDKILTHSETFDTLDELELEFQGLPLNIATVNRFSCKYFFCSELLADKFEVDSTRFYRLLKLRFVSPRMQSLLAQAPMVTLMGGRWWYGAPWRELKREYFGHLKALRLFHDVSYSPYAQRCRLYFLGRR